MQRIVLFDYGGVLADDHLDGAELELAKLLAVDRSAIRSQLSERGPHGAAFRRDELSEADFWSAVVYELGVESPPPYGALTRLWCETYRLRDDARNLLQELRRKRVVTGLVTNVDRARYAYLMDVVNISSYLDRIYPSFQYRRMKDSPTLWAAIWNELAAVYGTIAVCYVDDRSEHVKQAEDAGCSGIVFAGDMTMLSNQIESWYRTIKLE